MRREEGEKRKGEKESKRERERGKAVNESLPKPFTLLKQLGIDLRVKNEPTRQK